MNIQDQVCTLQQAMQLKALGVKQEESIFCYIGDDNPDPKYNIPHTLYLTEAAGGEVGKGFFDNRIAAFTVAELGEMLPHEILNPACMLNRQSAEETNTLVGIWKIGDSWNTRLIESLAFTNFKSEAEARAEFLIYLIENPAHSGFNLNPGIFN